MDRGNVPGPTWSKHKVRKINEPYGNIGIAKNVEKQLSLVSSSDENFHNIVPDYKLPKKQPRRPKPKVIMKSLPWSFRTNEDNSKRSTVNLSPLKEMSKNRNSTRVPERNGRQDG